MPKQALQNLAVVSREFQSKLEDASILIITNEELARDRVARVLLNADLQCLEFAENFSSASIAVNEHVPDLVILNTDLDAEANLEVCRRLRSLLDEQIPIILQLPRDDQLTRLKAFRAGATEIITDPSSEGEFILRVKRALERKNLVNQLRKDQARLQQDLQAAQNMQSALLPSEKNIAKFSEARNVEIESFYEASNMLGGDWWYAAAIDNSRLGIFLFDLSGHGVTAAINAFRLQLLVRSLKEYKAEPGLWMSTLNNELEKILPAEQFSTGFYGIYHKRKQTLEYVNAGSPCPFVFRKNGKAFQKLDSTGPILGCVSGIEYEAKTVTLKSNDRVFLYSDALYEDFDNPDNSLSSQELGEQISDILVNQKVEEGKFVEAVIQRMVDRTGKSKFDDDLTVLSMKVLPPKSIQEYCRTEAVKDCVWIASPQCDTISEELIEYLYGEYGASLHLGEELPPDSQVDFVITDEANLDKLQIAKENSTEFLSSIVIASSAVNQDIADFVLPETADIEMLKTVCRACREISQQSQNLRQEVSLRKSAIGTINNGEFSFKTLIEARNLSTMLAIACPNADLVAIGLRELMVNAVEHGNLEITSEQKQKLIMSGSWKAEIDRRLELPQYINREVVIRYARSSKRITFTIEDEGAGFDYAALDQETPSETTYRGRGIALAKQLAFPDIEYLGCGNKVRASIDL